MSRPFTETPHRLTETPHRPTGTPHRPRVGIIGARRVRQGLGPFIARDLVRAGADVACVLGTTQTTAEQAAADVEARAGQRPLAFADRNEFYAADLDAVCVLSPAGTHLPQLDLALANHCHVLCEKPVAWFPEEDWVPFLTSVEESYAQEGLVLTTNAQWPWVLPTYHELTGVDPASATSLAMGLSPASEGVTMLGDALPHPLSVAQAVDPTLHRAEDIRFELHSARSVTVEATLIGDSKQIGLRVELRGDAKEIPREAWLALDGVRADRRVQPSDYALSLESGGRSIDLPDPLTLRIDAFVASIRGPKVPRRPDRAISRRAAMLRDLVTAYDSALA